MDALIFLLNGQQTEVEALETFAADTDLLRASSGNVLAVLSKVDQAGDESDPLGFGRRKASRLMAVRDIESRVRDIVPVVGLVAETVRTDAIRAADIAALVRLANDPDRSLVLLSADLLREHGEPITARSVPGWSNCWGCTASASDWPPSPGTAATRRQ